ncbi:hypothetical protein SAPIO_CDS2614 [Scedosporium apiospermum]|uniref:DUF6594 domain-containing protein n=1 Tax=Pseudallescheria apiosperma TaxID=563466 RepID=A0A084GCV3_PSEDA|nr:uncharacterized protein SAPIO_CDS2614 [Scedosporium apiospermum]KEZ45165.1 hypothetical protein SAPIO_CDS2614 [Scedosporium apiospermum]
MSFQGRGIDEPLIDIPMMDSKKSNYTALASFLGSYPEVLAIRRFRELQIRNLLFYQAELAHLEAELQEIENQDAQRKYDPSDRANFRWTPCMVREKPAKTRAPDCAGGCQKPEDPSPPTSRETMNSSYLEKVLQIRRTLSSYMEQYKRLSALPNPKRRDMAAIHEWLNDMSLGTAFLAGDVEDVWTVELGDGKSKAADVSDFYGFEDQGGLAFPIGSAVAWLHRLFFRSNGSASRQPHHVDTSVYGALDQAITTVVASVLPVLPIVVLYFVKDMLVRIGLILVFTVVFSAILVVGLQIKPHATLAITTAIAAVQVVYVGSTASDGKSS